MTKSIELLKQMDMKSARRDKYDNTQKLYFEDWHEIIRPFSQVFILFEWYIFLDKMYLFFYQIKH